MDLYGLIGRKLGHSYSALYFNKYFSENSIDARYELFELSGIESLPFILNEKSNLIGLNVTIPFKTDVLSYLKSLTDRAAAIGAVNCIKIKRFKSPDGKRVCTELAGENTDASGFKQALLSILNKTGTDTNEIRALILGTGGASKAVIYALSELGIPAISVSRNPSIDEIGYDDLNRETVVNNRLIINCTPLGMFPDVSSFPPIPYKYIGNKHICFDLVYNPEVTEFMKKGAEQGAIVCNGFDMLINQANEAWDFWQKPYSKKYMSNTIEVTDLANNTEIFTNSIAELIYSYDGKIIDVKISPYVEEVPFVEYLDQPLLVDLNS